MLKLPFVTRKEFQAVSDRTAALEQWAKLVQQQLAGGPPAPSLAGGPPAPAPP